MNAYCPRASASPDSTRLAISVRTVVGNPQSLTFRQRIPDLVRWLIPSAILVLLPKCPACLAASIAFGTGVSLSLAAASYIKTLLVIMCVAALAYSVARYFLRPISLTFTPKETGQ